MSSSGKKESDDALNRILAKLRPFQREAFDFATKGTTYARQWASNDGYNSKPPKLDKEYLAKGRILLADEMGLGKTVTSLAIMSAYRNEWPLLILCPASLRYTWPAEIEKFLPTLPSNAVYVVKGFDDADFFSNPIKRGRIQIVVATYSLLQQRSAAARVLQQFDFQCVICDESHNLKDKKSQRCQLAMPLLQKAKRLVLLSGTPALARPVELWAQVHCIAPKLFGSYTAYTKRFCNAKRGRFGWDVTGLSNANELHEKLCQIMVRRLKSNVLHELPPKQRSIVPMQMDTSKVQECRGLMQELDNAKVSLNNELVGSEGNQAYFEHRRLLMQSYQASGVAKSKAVADYLLDWLAGSGTQKILVFGHHVQVLDTLEQAVAKKYKGIGHMRIDGSVSTAERAVRVRQFQSDPRMRVAVLSMTAAGVGLTLTAASSVLFAELHWTPGVLAQAEDRCHRISQQNAVNVMYCICKDETLSVDMRLWAMLGRKVGNLGKIIDGTRSASMNATESNPGNLSTNASGQSVEDELSSFFAETSADERKPTKAPPVKGSIMSFFKPPAAKKPSAANISAKVEPVGSLSQSLMKKANGGSSSMTSSFVARAGAVASKSETRPALDIVEWSCETCTYINSRKTPANGWLSCEMCGTTHMDEGSEEGTVGKVTPSISSASSERNRKENAAPVVDLCGGHDKTSSAKRKHNVCDEIISIDSDSDDSDAVTPPVCKRGRSSSGPRSASTGPGASEVIEIDVDEKPKSRDTSTTKPSRSVVTPAQSASQKNNAILGFTVSKNSGRITLHSAGKGESFHVNFDIHEIVSNETADAMFNVEVKRSSEKTTPIVILFSDEAISQVVRSIGDPRFMGRKAHEQSCDEIKAFVRAYLSLREVEKKAIKEWNDPVSADTLRQTLSQIMVSSVTTRCTERYEGGAKERALSNAKAGTASNLDKSVLAGSACAWCAGPLSDVASAPNVESTYCSHECAEAGRLGRGGMFASTRVRAQLFALEGGVCRKCGINAHALYVRICALQPPERLNALCNANWQLPKTGPALERLLQRPKEGDFWQADHIVAVASGGGSCSLDNLRTLCTPCHRVETDKLRARLRLTGGDDESNSTKQIDIRSAFFSQQTFGVKSP